MCLTVVSCQSDDLYPLVSMGIFFQDVPRGIGRAIIYAYCLKVMEGLCQQGIQAFAQILLGIVNRHQHCHFHLLNIFL
jgi:2-iminoacetate synthase ThiH